MISLQGAISVTRCKQQSLEGRSVIEDKRYREQRRGIREDNRYREKTILNITVIGNRKLDSWKVDTVIRTGSPQDNEQTLQRTMVTGNEHYRGYPLQGKSVTKDNGYRKRAL